MPQLAPTLPATSAPVSPSGDSAATWGRDAVAALWPRVQPQLEDLFGGGDYAAWLEPLCPMPEQCTASELALGAPTAFVAQWVQRHCVSQLEALLTETCGMPITIKLHIVPQFRFSSGKPAAAPQAPAAPTTVIKAELGDANTPEWLSGSRLDARYTFDTFVTGRSNQFAFTAAQRVAESLAAGTVTFNPFFVHGGVGLGKTHLMQAVGHAVLAAKGHTNVLYLSAEQFLYKFIRAMKDKNTMSFKEVFRSVDLLMIDDIQFIAGKDVTQEEFFHTFNTLVQSGKQIILTADRSPHELPNLEDRLKSRLGSGLTVEVHAPEEETRLAILHTKAESMGVAIPEEVLTLLATHIASNVRELEGALNRVVAYARFTGEALTPDMAREQLRDLFRVYTRVITIDDIQQKVSAQFNIRVADMHSPRRAREVARPRQVAMYLAKQLTSRSYPDIGRAFGGRDHTTVIHACEQVQNLLSRDSQLAEQVAILTRTLQGR